MTPDFEILADGKSITANIQDNLAGLTLTDKRNLEADQLDLRITDPEEKFPLPRKGAELQVLLGFNSTGLHDKGRFLVDEIEETGDMLTIRARSANFRGNLKEEQDRAWDGVTVGEIIRTLTAKHGMESAIDETLASIAIDHLDQTNESDINIIARLSKQYDALATIKSQRLLFLPAGQGTTASGAQLPTRTIIRTDASRHRYLDADRNSRYTGVRAKWHDTSAAKTKGELVGETGYVKTLRRTYPTQAEAADAAKSKWQEMSRGAKEMDISLAVGQPDIIANQPVRLEGWRPEITAINWTTVELIHHLNGSGLTTEVKLEQAL